MADADGNDPLGRTPHPARVRLRPWRLAAFAVSLGLTLSAVVGAVSGVIGAASPVQAVSGDAGSASGDAPEPDFSVTGAVDRLSAGLEAALHDAEAADPPAGSGAGRRVVFDQSAQRVWLVRDNASVLTSYPVSGSVHDNLSPGTYQVYSRSRDAVAFDYGSTMEYMVRFTQGASAAIGFHDIPLDDSSEPVQSVSELGTATSSGCIRQRERDARELWRFAPVGTSVVVVA